MKKGLILLILVLLLFSAVIVVAENGYSISWWSIDGGAQTVSGGDFSLSGISGQSDAGVSMSGENYTVTGGYWSSSESGGVGPQFRIYLPNIVK